MRAILGIRDDGAASERSSLRQGGPWNDGIAVLRAMRAITGPKTGEARRGEEDRATMALRSSGNTGMNTIPAPALPDCPLSYRIFAVSSIPLTSAESVEFTGVSTPWRLPISEM